MSTIGELGTFIARENAAAAAVAPAPAVRPIQPGPPNGKPLSSAS
jgi:hypothetical protein